MSQVATSRAPSADGDLVLAYLGGDDAAGEALVRRHHARLVRAMARWSHPDDAADIAQEAWVRAFEAMSRFDVTAPMWPWLRQIGDNVARSRLRRPRHETALDAVGECPPDELIADDGTDRLAEAAVVRDALSRLPERHRQTLSVVYLAGLEQSQAATALGISHGALRVRLTRARGELRQRLERVLGLPVLAPLRELLAPLASAPLAAAIATAVLLPYGAPPAGASVPSDEVTASSAPVVPADRLVGTAAASSSWSAGGGRDDRAAGRPDRDGRGGSPAGRVPEPDELGVPQRHVTTGVRVRTTYVRADDSEPPEDYPYEYRVQYVEEYHRVLRHNDEEHAEVHDAACGTADGLPRISCGPGE